MGIIVWEIDGVRNELGLGGLLLDLLSQTFD